MEKYYMFNVRVNVGENEHYASGTIATENKYFPAIKARKLVEGIIGKFDNAFFQDIVRIHKEDFAGLTLINVQMNNRINSR